MFLSDPLTPFLTADRARKHQRNGPKALSRRSSVLFAPASESELAFVPVAPPWAVDAKERPFANSGGEAPTALDSPLAASPGPNWMRVPSGRMPSRWSSSESRSSSRSSLTWRWEGVGWRPAPAGLSHYAQGGGGAASVRRLLLRYAQPLRASSRRGARCKPARSRQT